MKQFSTERVPVSLALLLDISGSMAQNPQARVAENARWADTRRALQLLLARLGAEDEVLFAVFNEQVAASAWTQDFGSILGTFDSLRPGGGTALLQAVKQIAFVFRTAPYQRKVLLLISDGNDTQVPAAGVLASPPYDIDSPEQKMAHAGESRPNAPRTRHWRVAERRAQVGRGAVCDRHRYPQRRACGHRPAGRSHERVRGLRRAAA